MMDQTNIKSENYITGVCNGSFNYQINKTPIKYEGNNDFRLNFDSNVATMWYMFANNDAIISLDLTQFDMYDVLDMDSAFRSCPNLTTIKMNGSTDQLTNMEAIFSSCSNLLYAELLINTSNVQDMGLLFNYCSKIESIDLSSFNTSNVTNVGYMFRQCINLNYLNLSNFDMEHVTYMRSMFEGCDKLTHIKCKTTFRDWCWANADIIVLPDAMKEGGSGTWELVD